MIQWIQRWRHKPQVVIGGIYRLQSDRYNPFYREVLVTVKDAQDGWVLYAMHPLGTGIFQNESKPTKEFLAIYRITRLKEAEGD